MMFMTIEGGEGAGKTELINALKLYFEDKGLNVMATREPGGVVIAEQIRNVILDVKNTDMDSMTEVLLFASARNQHLRQKVVPALKSGAVVICDRFIDSTYVYQGFVRDVPIEDIKTINEVVVGEYMPVLTLYLDVDPHIGLKRIASNKRREVNRLDLENIAFHTKVREGYLMLAKMEQERIVILDASKSKEDVFNQAVEVIERRLGEK